MQKGFLNKDDRETLYGPEGSPEGELSEQAKQQAVNDKMTQQVQDMQKAKHVADDKAGAGPEEPPPPWYTPEWPRKCQYNSPGCTLDPLKATGHKTDLHRETVQKNTRWQSALKKDATEIRVAFTGITDEDVPTLVEAIKDNERLILVDISQNKIADAGVQQLVSALASNGAKNLQELHIYNNEWTALGRQMIEGGLKILRPKLQVKCDPPEYLRGI
mmetsp:Transcript_24895/g.56895  ORF Transcript_24895/g.56895 Transcript_24895/m.56895 type:complete len:217 (+) Transcript_24895:173-823(+)